MVSKGLMQYYPVSSEKRNLHAFSMENIVYKCDLFYCFLPISRNICLEYAIRKLFCSEMQFKFSSRKYQIILHSPKIV